MGMTPSVMVNNLVLRVTRETRLETLPETAAATLNKDDWTLYPLLPPVHMSFQ